MRWKGANAGLDLHRRGVCALSLEPPRFRTGPRTPFPMVALAEVAEIEAAWVGAKLGSIRDGLCKMETAWGQQRRGNDVAARKTVRDAYAGTWWGVTGRHVLSHDYSDRDRRRATRGKEQ